MPFSAETRQGDFDSYTALDSIFPDPFTSVNEFIPKNRLETLKEFAAYPSRWSHFHHAVAFLDEARITQIFEQNIQFFNDAYHQNLFTLAIQRKNVKIILRVMKSLS